MICIRIKYGCGHLGVATFAIEVLRMSEIALDLHLPIRLTGQMIIYKLITQAFLVCLYWFVKSVVSEFHLYKILLLNLDLLTEFSCC